ncbi:MAG: TonB-dependent receptor [Bacteroidetes bacterium]|nr:TonB-dependent receptor [Bacteroidota bacterium]
MKKIYLAILLNLAIATSFISAQDSTTVSKKINLSEVTITSVKAVKGMGYLDEVSNGIIYSGKKTEVLITDSIDANTALNNPRQVMGRIPGAVFSETQGSGFPSNGVGFRGLNPSQSMETNTRMNGYNITADIYGYPEAYFLPNLEAVQRIEVIRGASSLQFGPQFGGVINYIIRDSPERKFEFTTEQTAGSYGMFNSFNSIGGKIKWFSYYGYFQFTHVNGWRPNSNYNQFSGYGKIQFTPNEMLKISLEYSALRNRIHMPGGFSDAQYEENIRASYRARNWLKSPWNVGAFKLEYNVSKNISINFTSSLLASARYLVWKNEDGGPEEPDEIDPATGTYGNREVEKETFLSTTNELRVTANYRIKKTQNTIAGGARFYYGKMHRQGGGLGTTGSDFDLSLMDPRFEYDLSFTTINVAPFVENIFRVTDKFSITPGFRFEFVNSTAKGYNVYDNYVVNADKATNRYIPLAGLGLQYKTTPTTSLYGNVTQAYRPTDYSQLSPIGTTSVIDPKMKDANGFNADLGFRGTVKNFLSFDFGAFYLQYNNRIGLVEKTDANGNTYTYRTNVANSRHAGAETYVEINLVKAFTSITKYGTISFFNSFTFIDARYVNGFYKNNFVENAPRFINRLGTTYAVQGFSITLLVSHTSKSFSDADNTVKSDDAVVGLIPSYTVLDLSASYKFLKRFQIKAGLNNVTGTKYFTKRTDEYPGPGIIPSLRRSFYVGLGAKF